MAPTRARISPLCSSPPRQEILVSNKGAGFTGAEGILGEATGTHFTLHQRQRLLPGVTEVSEQIESMVLYLMVVFDAAFDGVSSRWGGHA